MINTLIALQLLDMLTTYIALHHPRAREVNPFMAKLFAAVGVLPGLLLVKGGFVAFLLWSAPLLPSEALYLLIALYVWVFINNLRALIELYKPTEPPK